MVHHLDIIWALSKRDSQLLSWNKSQGRHSNIYNTDNNITSGTLERDKERRDFHKRKRKKKDNSASWKFCHSPEMANIWTNHIFLFIYF